MPLLSTLARAGGLALVSAAALAAPGGQVSVAFVQPEQYTDVGYRSAVAADDDRAEVLQALEAHLVRLGERLPADRSLKVEVLDVDLAGSFEPWRTRGEEVRIVRAISWPKIRLRYTLSQGGRVLAEAEEQLSDMNYLRSHNRYGPNDRLRYEKVMLDDWFRRSIQPR